MAAGYTERWAEAEELDVSDLGLEKESPEEKVLANILKLQVCIATALSVGSEEARRDWCKLCTLERKLLEESGRKLWTSDDELEVVESAPPSATRKRTASVSAPARSSDPKQPQRTMADFAIAIPSYNRADQLFERTYERILLPMGLTSKALVFLQTDEDERVYRERFAGTGVSFVRAPQKGFAAVNHFIEHYFDTGTKVVVMHDDLKAILKLTTAGESWVTLDNLG